MNREAQALVTLDAPSERRRRGACILLGLLSVACATAARGQEPHRHASPHDSLVAVWGRATLSHHASPEHGSWLSIATRGDGSGADVRSAKPKWGPGEVARGFVRARIRISALDRLGGVELRLSDTPSFERFLLFDIPFYADTTFNRLWSGEWTTVSFPFAQARWVGEPDLERLTYYGWFVHDNGTGGIIVDVGEVELVPRAAEGIVSFTFDDGYADQLGGAEMLSKAGFAATAYVIPRHIGEGAFLDAEQLRHLADDHRWEIASHHGLPFTDFTREALEEEIAFGFEVLERIGFSSSARHLAYPLGKHDREVVLPAVRASFFSARLAAGGLETLPPADWHLLRAVNVLPTTSPEELAALVRDARANGEWAILMFHHLVDSPRLDTEYGISDFDHLVALVEESGVAVLTVGEVWKRFHRGAPGTEE